MNRHLYDKLALCRMSLIKKYDEKKYREIDNIYCQLYDIAEANQKKSGKLPNIFFLYKVGISEEELKKVFNDLEIKADFQFLNSGYQFGNMYQVTLIK